MNPSEPSSTETLRYNEFTLDDTETRLYAGLYLTDQNINALFAYDINIDLLLISLKVCMSETTVVSYV